MIHITETRRGALQGFRERASEDVLDRNSPEDTAQTPIVQQAAWLTARYSMGEARARVVAEHAFARRPQR